MNMERRYPADHNVLVDENMDILACEAIRGRGHHHVFAREERETRA
jgi:hypothetical protein